MTRISHRSRVAAAVACLGLASSALVGTATVAAADEAGPAIDGCLEIPQDRAFDATTSFEIVDCAEPHNAQVFERIAYPDDLGAPSTISDRVYELFGGTCNYDNYLRWLGAAKVKLPIQGYTVPRLPSDDEWKAGARWVACSAFIPDAKGNLTSLEGSLPARFASTPILDWLLCAAGTPKSGQWNKPVSCTGSAKWLVVPGGQVKGKIGNTYPKDLQSKANAMCAKNAKPYLKKGAKSKAVAGLGPKTDFPEGNPFADCFIVKADWSGKTG